MAERTRAVTELEKKQEQQISDLLARVSELERLDHNARIDELLASNRGMAKLTSNLKAEAMALGMRADATEADLEIANVYIQRLEHSIDIVRVLVPMILKDEPV